MGNAGRSSSWLTIVLSILVVALGVEVIYLIQQNRRLQSMVASSASFQVLQPGQFVPELIATGLDGSEVAIRYGNGQPSTLLIWFSPSCHICAENAAFWNQANDRYGASDGVRVLAMSDADAEATRGYMDENALKLPVVCVLRPSMVEAFNGHVVPQTALISPHGRIQRIWPGALEASRQNEITSALDSLVSSTQLTGKEVK